MKAVILAGGRGTRAKPFTDFFPKAMMPINEKPLISYVVNYLSSFRIIDQIIIISDFKNLGGQIIHYFDGKKNAKKIKFVQDSGSGTAGDLVHVSNLLKNDSEFILWFVDNLCAIDISKMYKYFKKNKSLACIATRNYRKEETGFAVVKDGIIKKFEEKPIIKLQNSECLGIYMLGTKIIESIKKKSKKNLNLSYDILEDLARKNLVRAYDIRKTPWIDAESPTIVLRHKKIVDKIIQQMKN